MPKAGFLWTAAIIRIIITAAAHSPISSNHKAHSKHRLHLCINFRLDNDATASRETNNSTVFPL